MSDVMTPMSRLMQGVIPYLALKGADDAVAFYRRAFGAVLRGDIHRDEQGRIYHACLEINGGALMLSDHFHETGAAPAESDCGAGLTLQIVTDDGESFFQRAVEAGCTVTLPFEAQFWGDRYGRLEDPFGLSWAVNEPSPESRDAHA